MLCRFIVPLALGLLAVAGGTASAQTPAQPTTGALLAQSFEVKAVINNTYLILQKGDKAFWCGTADPGLTWANWPQLTRDATCVPLTK